MPVKRDGWVVGLAWVVLTVLGEILLWNLPIFPPEGAREAAVADEAFRMLTRLAVPVFAFVVVILVFSVLRFRARGRPTDDGPPLWGSRRVFALWLGVTSLLALVLIVNPGLTGLAKIRQGWSRARPHLRGSPAQDFSRRSPTAGVTQPISLMMATACLTR